VEYLHIKNWDKFQHYKDRNPPWVKLYHSLLDDYDYGCLQDDSKLLLMSFYMLASITENRIPGDLEWIQRKAMIKREIQIEELVNAGFIYISNGDGVLCKQVDSKLIAERLQDA